MTAPRRPTAGRRPARPGARPRTTTRSTATRAGAGTGRASNGTSQVAGRPAKRPGEAVRRTPLTPRAAVLALVVCGLLVSAALPGREYLAQRGEIAELERAQAQTEARVAELRAEKARLQDPAYIAAEARRRLNFVFPGETAYVIEAPPEPAPEAGGPGQASPDSPWYSQVWGTVVEADRPAPAPAP